MPSMPHDLTIEELRALDYKIQWIREAYEFAKKHGTLSREWMRFLEEQLKKWEAQFPQGGSPKKKHRSLWYRIKNHCKKHWAKKRGR